MANLNDVFTGKSLKASDLQGRDVTLTISDVQVVEFDDGPKLEISFDGTGRTFICNKTNAGLIAEHHGMVYTDWPGKAITIYPTRTDFGGKMVPCIRVRAPEEIQGAQQPSAPAPPETLDNGAEVPF